MKQDVPLIDLKHFDGQKLHETLRYTGFAYLVGHDISDHHVQRILDFGKRFFAESLEFKSRIAMKHAGMAWRGYFPVGAELTAGKVDGKEGLYLGEEHKSDHPGVENRWPMHGRNQWPSGKAYDGFAEAVLSYMQEMTALGHTLMSHVAVALGLENDYFRRRFSDQPTILTRLFNYPQSENTPGEWGVGEHTDMGFLTILKQDNSGGLQVKDFEGVWIDVPPVANSFVINIGDMLQYWTNGIYRATPHRVQNVSHGDRLSLPFFFDPNWSCPLTPISRKLLRSTDLQAVRQERGDRWDGLDLSALGSDITYGDFVWNKVRDVFPDLAKVSR